MGKSKFSMDANPEQGSASVLIAMMTVFLSIVTLTFLSNQASQELDLELHKELVADKSYVRSTLRWNALCDQDLAQSSTCPAGEIIEIEHRQGGVLVKKSGETKIGKWNVRVKCGPDKKLGYGYHVQLARIGEGNIFLDDPHTKAILSWRNYIPMKVFCEAGPSKDDKILSNTCYGNISGKDEVISDLKPHCPGCSSSPNFYCADNQISFPTCPSGYRVAIRYIDRFGWGGIDLNKITVCRKK